MNGQSNRWSNQNDKFSVSYTSKPKYPNFAIEDPTSCTETEEEKKTLHRVIGELVYEGLRVRPLHRNRGQFSAESHQNSHHMPLASCLTHPCSNRPNYSQDELLNYRLNHYVKMRTEKVPWSVRIGHQKIQKWWRRRRRRQVERKLNKC